ncbi:MAG: hypothetical protein LBD82_02435, partial [Deltaproteobacteria bacterium]|nr:hypothetical protein [Deltaproteobacteria bacterium]
MKNILFRLPLAPFIPKTKASSSPKILLVRDDIIGDLLVPTSAVVKWLKDRQHDVFLVLRREFMPIGRLMLPEDRLIPLDMSAYRSSPRYRWNFLKHIRWLGLTLAIGSTIHSSVNDDIVRSSGAPARYGYQRRSSIEELWKLRRISKVRALPAMRGSIYAHMLEHERHFLSHIFSTPVDTLYPHVRTEKVKPAGMPDKYIHYVADAGNMRRVFPAARLLPILERLAKTHSIPLVLTALKPIPYTHKHCLNLSGRLRLE